MFVQIASLCLSDQKDVSLNLTFHITTLMQAGDQQGRVGAMLAVPLSAQCTLGKATTLWPDCPVADLSVATGILPGTIKQEDLVHTTAQ